MFKLFPKLFFKLISNLFQTISQTIEPISARNDFPSFYHRKHSLSFLPIADTGKEKWFFLPETFFLVVLLALSISVLVQWCSLSYKNLDTKIGTPPPPTPSPQPKQGPRSWILTHHDPRKRASNCDVRAFLQSCHVFHSWELVPFLSFLVLGIEAFSACFWY